MVLNTLVPLLPLAAGHAALSLAGLPARHDITAVILGVYLLWAAAMVLRQLSRLAQVTPPPSPIFRLRSAKFDQKQRGQSMYCVDLF